MEILISPFSVDVVLQLSEQSQPAGHGLPSSRAIMQVTVGVVGLDEEKMVNPTVSVVA